MAFSDALDSASTYTDGNILFDSSAIVSMATLLPALICAPAFDDDDQRQVLFLQKPSPWLEVH